MRKQFWYGVLNGIAGCFVVLCAWSLIPDRTPTPGIQFPFEWASDNPQDVETMKRMNAVAVKAKLDVMKRRYRQWAKAEGLKNPGSDIEVRIARTTPDIESKLDPYDP